MGILSQWEADARESSDMVAEPHPDSDKRILILIDLVRKKDDLIRYCIGPTRDVKTPKLQEALALTEELK